MDLCLLLGAREDVLLNNWPLVIWKKMHNINDLDAALAVSLYRVVKAFGCFTGVGCCDLTVPHRNHKPHTGTGHCETKRRMQKTSQNESYF